MPHPSPSFSNAKPDPFPPQPPKTDPDVIPNPEKKDPLPPSQPDVYPPTEPGNPSSPVTPEF